MEAAMQRRRPSHVQQFQVVMRKFEELYATGQKHQHLRTVPLKQNVRCLCVVGDQLWEGSSDGTVHILDLYTFEPISTIKPDKIQTAGAGDENEPFYVNAIFAQGNKVWVGTSDGVLRAYDFDGKQLFKNREHRAAIKCIAGISLSVIGRSEPIHLLWTASEDFTILQRDPQDGHGIKQLLGHTSWVRCLAVAVIPAKSQTPTPEQSSSEQRQQTPGDGVKPTNNSGASLVASSSTSSLPAAADAFDDEPKDLEMPVSGPVMASSSVEFRPPDAKGDFTVTSLEKIRIQLWSGSDDGVRVWDENGKCLAVMKHHGLVADVINGDQKGGGTEADKVIVTDNASTAGDEPEVEETKFKTSTLTSDYAKVSTVTSLIVVDDNVWSGGADSYICVYSCRDLKLIKKWKAHQNWVTQLQYVGKDVWSASFQKRITIWHTDGQRNPRSLTEFSGKISDIVYLNHRVWIGCRERPSLNLYRLYSDKVSFRLAAMKFKYRSHHNLVLKERIEAERKQREEEERQKREIARLAAEQAAAAEAEAMRQEQERIKELERQRELELKKQQELEKEKEKENEKAKQQTQQQLPQQPSQVPQSNDAQITNEHEVKKQVVKSKLLRAATTNSRNIIRKGTLGKIKRERAKSQQKQDEEDSEDTEDAEGADEAEDEEHIEPQVATESKDNATGSSQSLAAEEQKNKQETEEKPAVRKIHAQSSTQIDEKGDAQKPSIKRVGSTGSLSDHSRIQGEKLIEAATKNNLGDAEWLLKTGVSVDYQQPDGLTALIAAAYNGCAGLMCMLLEKGARINHSSNDGVTALIAAALVGRHDITKILLEHKADLHAAMAGGFTALMAASKEGHAKVVELLLAHGADINYVEKDGDTALMHATYEGHTEICQMLIKAGAKVNHSRETGSTPLIIAASEGFLDIVELLLKSGAEVNLTNKSDGWTPLMSACSNGHLEVAKMLIDKGANVNYVTPQDGWTALTAAIHCDHLELVKYLLERGAQLDHMTKDGQNIQKLAQSNEMKDFLRMAKIKYRNRK